jgi:hypothetical protein
MNEKKVAQTPAGSLLTRWPATPLSRLPGAAVLAFAAGCASVSEPPPSLAAALDAVYDDIPGPIHYFAAASDLDGDGRNEWVVYVAGPSVCGTGGCNTHVFSTSAQGTLELVTTLSVSGPPVVAADTRSDGWRDLVVRVSGGGLLPGYDARLRYDAATGSYPANPTVAPAERVEVTVEGDVLIMEFDSFREGTPLGR